MKNIFSLRKFFVAFWVGNVLCFSPGIAQENKDAFPQITEKHEVDIQGKKYYWVTANGIKGLVAKEPISIKEMAQIASKPLATFIKNNDLAASTEALPEVVYYLGEKGKTAKVAQHTLQKNETLWLVAQKYGIQLKSIIKYNRLENNTKAPVAGLVLWLQAKRPKNIEPEIKTVEGKETGEEDLTAQFEKIKANLEKKDSAAQANSQTSSTLSDAQQGKTSETIKTENSGVIASTTTTSTKTEYKQGAETTSEISTSNPTQTLAKDQNTAETKQEAKKEEVKNGGEKKYHLFTDGETIWTIARMYDISQEQILAWNNLPAGTMEVPEGTKLIVGESGNDSKTQETAVSINGGNMTFDVHRTDEATANTGLHDIMSMANAATPDYHTIEAGETISHVAGRYNLRQKDIMKWNNLDDKSVLHLGQRLVLKASLALPKPVTQKVTKTDTTKTITQTQQTTKTNVKTPTQNNTNTTTTKKVEVQTQAEPDPLANIKSGEVAIVNNEPVRIHIVEAGETLRQLSLYYQTDVAELMLLNSLSSPDKIHTGQRLIIKKEPIPAANSMGGFYHIVQHNENLYTVCGLYGIKIDELRSLNKLPQDQVDIPASTQLQIKPIPLPNAFGENFHVVQPKENLYQICATYGVKIDEIRSLNGLSPYLVDVPVGQKLMLRKEQIGTYNSAGVGFHVVQQNEKLGDICVRYNLKVEDLQKWNKIPQNLLEVVAGTKLAVSEKNAIKDNNFRYHLVKRSETLYSISKQYNISIDQLKDWNKRNENVVYAEETLIVGEYGK